MSIAKPFLTPDADAEALTEALNLLATAADETASTVAEILTDAPEQFEGLSVSAVIAHARTAQRRLDEMITDLTDARMSR